jgi:hypothetical protein
MFKMLLSLGLKSTLFNRIPIELRLPQACRETKGMGVTLFLLRFKIAKSSHWFAGYKQNRIHSL